MNGQEKAQAILQAAKVSNDWQKAAVSIAKLIPKPRAPRRSKGHGTRLATATFMDGSTVIMGFYSKAGKPMDWARAAWNCERKYKAQQVAFPCAQDEELHHASPTSIARLNLYERRIALVQAPAIIHIIEAGSGEQWQPKERIAA